MDKLILKMARHKYARIYLQSKNRKKTVGEILSVSLSILHDSCRNEEWAKKIRELIHLTDGGIDVSL